MADFHRYLPIAKVDDEQRMVWGYASTPALDLDDEIVKVSAIKAALPDYMQWANIREMHGPSAVGTAEHAEIHDNQGLWLGAHIVDDQAWRKVKKKVYKGFSIGGSVKKKVGKFIEELQLIEISLVDRPANPECRIEVVKGEKIVTGGVAELLTVDQMAEAVRKGTPVAANFSHEEVGLLGRIIAKLGKGRSDMGGPAAGIEIFDPQHSAYFQSEYPPSGTQVTTDKQPQPGADTAGQADGHQSVTADPHAAPGGTEDSNLPAPAQTSTDLIDDWEVGQAALSPAADAFRSEADGSGKPLNGTGKAAGESDMTKTDIEKRTSGKALAAKAAHHVEAAMGCAKSAGDSIAALRNLHMEAAKKGASVPFDHTAALDHITKMGGAMGAMADHHDMASHFASKAAGIGSAESAAADWAGQTTSGVEIPAGIAPPATGPTPGKNSDAEPTYTKAQVDELVEARTKAAAAEARVAALEGQMANTPAGRLRGRPFEIGKSASDIAALGGAGGTPEGDRTALLLKGVPDLIGSGSPEERQQASARAIGNMIKNSAVFGRNPVTDPNFHGAAAG